MRQQSVILIVETLLILLSLIAAFYIDESPALRNQFVSVVFVVPVLIAADRWTSRAAIVTAMFAFAVAIIATPFGQLSTVSLLLHLAGFLVASILAILLGHQRRVAAQLARELHTIIETMPAGVVVADAGGAITLTNTAAASFFGGTIRANAYTPTSRYVLEYPDGTPFPSHEHPLLRAIERGETTRDVVARVRRDDGTERMIVASGSPVRDETGRVTGAVAVLGDITERLRAEDALRASQASLARAQEVAQLGDWDRDVRTGHVRWSDEVYRIFGLTPSTVVDTFAAVQQCIHPDDRARVDQCLSELLATGSDCRIDYRIVHPDGTLRDIHAEARVQRDSGEQPVHILGTVQDITERKRAEEERDLLFQQVQVERARLEAILNSSGNATIFVDTASKLVRVNPAAERLFGHSFVPEKGQDQYLPQLRSPDGQPITLDELPTRRTLKKQVNVQQEFLVVQRGGERIPVLESSAPVHTKDGQFIGAVALIQDISALKEVERLREEWTSVVAHDLRQPVTVILGYAGLLEERVLESSPLYAPVGHIAESAHLLRRMIQDLLDASRIETHRLALDRRVVNLTALVSEIIERASKLTLNHVVSVTVCAVIPPICGDPIRIEQVMTNLLTNAARYGEPRSNIVVLLDVADDAVKVGVRNRGPGIPPEEIPNLFNRFVRSHGAQERTREGLGLGLYIAKGLVEAHGGYIWVESSPGETTTFWFTLPIEHNE
jgi:PAS domain S-box-containing protein